MTIDVVFDVILDELRMKDATIGVNGGTVTNVATSGIATGGNITTTGTIDVPKSTQAQAIAGTDDETAMTPLRVKEAIDAKTPAPTVPITDESTDITTNLIFTNDPTGNQALHSNSDLTFNSTTGTINTDNLSLEEQITIKGGVPGIDKVLTSDASGLATWETPPATVQVTDESTDTTTNLLFTNDATGNQALHSNSDLTFNSTTGTINTDNLSLEGQIAIKGGSPGANKILTSDDFGSAAWEDPAAASTIQITDEPADTSTSLIFTNDAIGEQELHTNTALKFDSATGTVATNNLLLEEQITIKGGSPGVDKVLTSDASGLATWEASPVTSIIQITDESADTTTSVLFTNDAIGNHAIHSNTNLAFDSATGTVATNNLLLTEDLLLDGQITIKGGVPGVDKVLTSDIDGLATWETPPTTVQVTNESLDTTASLLFTNDPTGDQELHSNANLTFDSATGTVDTISIALTGNITVGTQIKIVGGSPGIDKVLTSDINGLATWETQPVTSIVQITNESIDTTNSLLFTNDSTGEQTLHSNANLSFNSATGTINTDNLLLDGQVTIKGGSPGTDKVLTSDIDGLATWETQPVTSIVQVTDESADTTTNLLFTNDPTGDQELHSNTNLTFDSATGTVATNNLLLEEQVTIKGGSPGVDKVLTSDIDGLSTWESPLWTKSELDENIYRTEGNIGIKTTTPMTALEVVGDITSKGTEWTSRTSVLDNDWQDIIYGNGLFVAVSSTGSGNRIMTSSDGINWIIGTSAVDNGWNSITYGNGIFVAVSIDGAGDRIITSPNGVNWTSRINPLDNDWTGIAYGNNIFVAVSKTGIDNRVMTSPDGINWGIRISEADNDWQDITYGNGLFVAIASTGSGNRVMTSPDGITWTIRTSAADNDWQDIIYGNGLFVAVSSTGSGNRVMTSPDGITWTSHLTPEDNDWTAITYGNGLFVAVSRTGTDNRVMTSHNGFNWILRTSTEDNDWTAITYGNGLFVAVSRTGIDNRVMTSGKVEISIIPTNNLYHGGMTITGQVSIKDGTEGTGYFLTSDANGLATWKALGEAIGSLWTESPSEEDDNIYRTDGNVGINTQVPTTALEVVGNITSKGTEWTSQVANNGFWHDIAYGNGLFVAVSRSDIADRIITSPDGVNWTSRDVLGSHNWRDIIYGNGLFVAVSNTGSGDRVVTSEDGVNWALRTSAADIGWRGIAYGNGLFVAVANNGTDRVMTSPDGLTWTSRTGVVDNDWMSVVYANSIFVAVAKSGIDNRVMTSPDGINWTIGDTPANNDNQWRSITYGNGLFVAVAESGTDDRVMTSPDGFTWTLRTSAVDNLWYGITYGNGLFVAVSADGTDDRVMTSPDGINWISRTSAADNSWMGIAYGNGVFVAVADSGIGNRVMTSGKIEINVVPSDNIYHGGMAITGAVAIAGAVGIIDGTEGLGKVLTSNEVGAATWETPMASGVASKGITWTGQDSPSTNNWVAVAYRLGLFAAVSNTGTGNGVMTSPDGITWTIRTSAADENWACITTGFANVTPIFVALSTTGGLIRCMTSYDGILWTLRALPVGENWLAVTYGNGIFVAVADSGTDRVMTSPDGLTWTMRTSAAGNSWRGVTYGNGLYVAVAGTGVNNRVMTSPDSINWTIQVSAANNNWQSVTYGNGLFVAVSADGTNNQIMTSPDGINWTTRFSPAINQWCSIIYGNGLFVAVADNSIGDQTMTSTDGFVWTLTGESDNSPWNGVVYGDGKFVAVSDDSVNSKVMTGEISDPIWQESNGSAFREGPVGIGTQEPSTALEVVGDITADGMTVNDQIKITGGVPGADKVLTSDIDGLATWEKLPSIGAEWTNQTSATDSNWQKVAYGNGLFVAVALGTSNTLMTSPNGIAWTTRTSAIEKNWTAITYGNGLFVAVSSSGSGNRVMTSPDGINWTIRTTPVDNAWQHITYGNGLFVAVSTNGSNNQVMTSPDGITWTTRVNSSNEVWISVTYGNGLFAAVAFLSAVNQIMTSPDGINWTNRVSQQNSRWRSITYGNGLFVITGEGGFTSIQTSPDGITWTIRDTPLRAWRSTVYGNGIFVSVASTGTGDRVMTSPDGITWTLRTGVVDNFWNWVTYGNGIFVAIARTGKGNRAMTSGKALKNITPTNNIYQGGITVTGVTKVSNLQINTATPSIPGQIWVAIDTNGNGEWQDK